MKMKRNAVVVFLSFLLLSLYAGRPDQFPALKGPYLGQPLPGDVPEFFAPGIVTTQYHEHSAPAFSPDGSEVYWSAFLGPLQSRAPQVILFRGDKNKWAQRISLGAPVCSADNDRFPKVSPDGKVLFFASKRTSIRAYYEKAQRLNELMARYARPGNGLTDIYWVDAKFIEALKPEK